MKRTCVHISAQPGDEAREVWRAFGRLTENVGALWVLRSAGEGRTTFSLCFDGDFGQSVWDELAEITPLASKFKVEVREE